MSPLFQRLSGQCWSEGGIEKGNLCLIGESIKCQSEHIECVRHSEETCKSLRPWGEREGGEGPKKKENRALEWFAFFRHKIERSQEHSRHRAKYSWVQLRSGSRPSVCVVSGYPGSEIRSYGNGIKRRKISSKLKNRIRQDTNALASSTLGGGVERGCAKDKTMNVKGAN